MRPYELMVIYDGDLDDGAVQAQVDRLAEQIQAGGGRVASTERWGRRRFAYEIDHKTEGHYVVFELLCESAVVDGLDRQLRLADEVVRQKFIRLPDSEAARRGLLGGEQAGAAAAG